MDVKFTGQNIHMVFFDDLLHAVDLMGKLLNKEDPAEDDTKAAKRPTMLSSPAKTSRR